jgi:protein-L-isoaspartate(D-aspartate) O-methyltransferase
MSGTNDERTGVRRQGQSEEIAGLRNRLADQLFADRPGSSKAVEDAFRAVSRHLFLPGVDIPNAYEDAAIVTVREVDGRPLSSSSQPLIMAIMLEQLGVGPGENVLEIGAGTGFNAALLAHMVGENGRVTTLDIDEEIVFSADEHLRSTGFGRVAVLTADGADGYPDRAPYDRIILTVGAADISPAWIDQLKEGGRLVLPLSLRGIQRSVAFERRGDHLESVSVVDCGFMPMRGALAGAAPPFRIVAGDPTMFIVLDDDRTVDTTALSQALRVARDSHPSAIDTGVTANPAGAYGPLGLWMVLRDPDAGQMTALGALSESSTMPAFVTDPGFVRTIVLVGEDRIAALVRLRDEPHDPNEAGAFRLGILPVGRPGDGLSDLADRMVGHVRDWDAASRPKTATLKISVFPLPANTEPDTGANRFVFKKPCSSIVVDW